MVSYTVTMKTVFIIGCCLSLACYKVYCQTAESIIRSNVAFNQQPTVQARRIGAAGRPGEDGADGPGPLSRSEMRRLDSLTQPNSHRAVLRSSPPDTTSLSLANLMAQSLDDLIGFMAGEDSPSPYINNGTTAAADCPFTTSTTACDAKSPFRTADGSCNNLGYPSFGQAKTAMARLVRARYDDGVSTPRRRQFESDEELPSAREVSTTVHPTASLPSDINSHMLMGFSQFVDHDLTLTPSEGAEGEGEGSGPACCAEEVEPNSSRQRLETLQAQLNARDECFPIEIPSNDPVIRNATCMSVVRSAPAPRPFCGIQPRQQLDDLTHYLDASMIYGSSKRKMRELRSFRNGKLKVQIIKGRENLPDRRDSRRSACRRVTAPMNCSFDAGDVRNSEQAGLTSQHVLWLRAHNNIAHQIKFYNPKWSDEEIFQTTRKIIGAMVQHIIYNEWLPIVIGRDLVNRYGLKPLRKGFFKFYNRRLDVSIWNEFATAAFRFGHSLISQRFSLANRHVQSQRSFDLSTIFSAVSTIRRFGPDGLLVGQVADSAEELDRFCVNGICNRLFNMELDLFALNIQRGRDHGLGSYNDYRRLFKLGTASSFSQLRSHDRATVAALKRVYPDTEDMELWPAGISETPLRGALVGSVFANIIALQFFKDKFADRFYYETNDPVTGFTAGQLQEIRKTTLSWLICSTTDVKQLPPDPFRQPDSRGNRPRNCNSFPTPDFSKWIEGGDSQPAKDDCKWGHWGRWGSCYRGLKRRSRRCQRETSKKFCNSHSCGGRSTETRRCSSPAPRPPRPQTPAPQACNWTSWGHWSSCQNGLRQRRRYCKRVYSGRYCHRSECGGGKNSQAQRCSTYRQRQPQSWRNNNWY